MNIPAQSIVTKWPDSFYEKFKDLKLNPRSYNFDDEENLIEKADEDFYEKWGQPRAVGLVGYPMKFTSDNNDKYEIKLEATQIYDPNSKPDDEFQYLPWGIRQNSVDPSSSYL